MRCRPVVLALTVTTLAFAQPWPTAASPATVTAVAWFPPDSSGIDAFGAAVARAHDDPRTALKDARDRASATGLDADDRFWAWLAVARIHGLLEQPAQARRALDTARAVLDEVPGAAALHRLALHVQEVQAATLSDEPRDLQHRLAAVWPNILAEKNARLSCDAENLQSWILLETGELDEAFEATQRVEHCAAALADVELQASAALQMGMLAGRVASAQAGAQGPLLHFSRALQILGNRPARYLRSIIEWELGKFANLQDPARELAHFERARALSQEIDDDVGVALASVDIATAELKAGHTARALQMATDARMRYLRNDAHHRVAPTYSIAIVAMTQRQDPGLLDEIEAARRFDGPSVSPRERSRLARAMAEGYASVGRFRDAFSEMRRSSDLAAEGRDDEAHRAMQQLQASYESAQREAENARLRLRAESARLQLETAGARQQTLWIGVLALGAALGGAALLMVLTWRQRRALAALALRDELTGAPNRRAVLSIAQTQFAYCRRLGMPLGIAIVDLDHFKCVNDSYGHDTGDEALRSFAAAAKNVLRAQDGLGRYGGEEWLMVMPGADADTLAGVFARLRQQFADIGIAGMPSPHGLTFSMGAVQDDGRAATVGELVAEADRRLYRAKAAGRDRIVSTPDPAGAPVLRPVSSERTVGVAPSAR